MKHFFTLFFVLIATLSAYAQDIIIKTDKSEVKAKVLEIEEFNIKYKQWDFQEGPTYSIKKNEVFMIIYKNGKRETFDATPAPAVNRSTNQAASNQEAKQSPAILANVTASLKQDNSTSNSGDHVNYKPVKLIAYIGGLSGSSSGTDYEASGFSLEGSMEKTLLKNYLNWGVSAFFTSVTSEATSSYSSASGDATGFGLGAYVAGFVSINRMTGKVDKQNVGIFPFVRAGLTYSYLTMSAEGESNGGAYTYESPDYEYSGIGGDIRLGADYKFTEKFGITVQTNFGAIGGGINFQF